MKFGRLCTAGMMAASGMLLTTSPARAQRVRGVDVSQYQGAMNWNTAYDAGVRFTFVRSSRGGLTSDMGRVEDTRFQENMAAIENLADNGKTIYAGAYHFGRPDLVPSGSPATLQTRLTNHAKAEASHFVQVAGSYMTDGWLRPVLDLEAGGSDLSSASLTFWAHSFIDEVEELTGAEPLVYMNTNYAKNYVDESLGSRDIWIANWEQQDYGNPLTVGSPPTGNVDDWSFWQYSADGNGMGSTFGGSSYAIDLDVANGDLAFVQSFLVPEPASAGLLFAAGLLLRRNRRA